MDLFSLLVGVSASIIAILLGVLTTIGRIKRGLKKLTEEVLAEPQVESMLRGVVRDVLLETGLIRYRRFKPETQWPNGWDNLPEALAGIAKRVDDHLAAHATSDS